jgi:hypothetical protein
MSSNEYPLRAVQLCIKLDKRIGLTIRQLGHPPPLDTAPVNQGEGIAATRVAFDPLHHHSNAPAHTACRRRNLPASQCRSPVKRGLTLQTDNMHDTW